MALTTVPTSLSATALTLTTAAQPNITSVGTLSSLTVSGNIIGGGNGSASGVTLSDGSVKINTGTGVVAAVDFYCEVNNAHRVRLKSPAHANFSGNVDVVLPNYSGTLLAENSSGYVGIGTSSPGEMLEVEGDVDGEVAIKVQNTSSGSSAYAALYLQGDGNNFRIKNWGDGTSDANATEFISTAGSSQFIFTPANTEAMRIDSSGNVGIGTSSPSTSLDISHQISSTGIEYPLLIAGIDTGNTQDQVVGSGIGLQFKLAGNASSGDSLVGAGIVAMRENASDADSSTGLAFQISQNDTTLDEVMRINSSGDVGINITSPAAELHVNSLSENVNLRLTRDTNYGVQITGTDGANTTKLKLGTINNGTLTERLQMTETDLKPITDQGMGLGTASYRWDKLHVRTTAHQDFYILSENTTANSSFTASYFNTTLSGSDSLTADRANYGIYSALNSSATGGDTSNEHRLYGIRSLVKATGDSDLIYGGYFTGEAEHSSGSVTHLYGSYNRGIADPNSGGTVTITYGAYNEASINASAGSSAPTAYGSWNRVITSSTDAVAHTSLTGCYAEIETDASGTARTSTNGYLFRGVYDDDSSAEHKFTNFYGLHIGGTSLSSRVDGTGNSAGVYLSISGADQGFWNSVDQPNHFRGSLSIGSGGREVGDTVGAELHLVEPDGGEMVLARYDPTIGTNNSLGKILFGGTEDSGSTVNFSASIQAFAQSAHSTSDSDGYLSFYTVPQSSTTLTERVRITRDGHMLNYGGTNSTAQQGVTTYGDGANGHYVSCTGTCNYWVTNHGQSSTTGTLSTFYNNTTAAGGITIQNTSDVVYGGTSDYRRKENVADMVDATARLKQLRPITFNWIDGGVASEGFLAHEVQTIVPTAVTGVKDQVFDEEDAKDDPNVEVGGIKNQLLDPAKLVPMLVKAMQEQQELIETLQTKVAALEAK